MHGTFIISDETHKKSNQSRNKVINTTHSKKYKRNNFEDGSNFSRTNKMYSSESLQSADNIVRRQSNGLDDDKMNFIHSNSGKLLENKYPEKSMTTFKNKSEVLAVKSRNNNKQNARKSRRKNTIDRYKKLILFNQVNVLPIASIKYRMVRSPGCWIPIFMFINRGSYEDITILKNVISSGMSYLMIEKNEQVYSKINYIDNMLNNYSLI